MRHDKRHQTLEIVGDDAAAHLQKVPNQAARIAKLERYLATLPKGHPKRGRYAKQLKELKTDG